MRSRPTARPSSRWLPATTLGDAYEDLAEQIKKTINQYPKDKGLRSIMLNTLLCYPDHPFGFETIYRKMWDRKAREYTIIKVAEPAILDRRSHLSERT